VGLVDTFLGAGAGQLKMGSLEAYDVATAGPCAATAVGAGSAVTAAAVVLMALATRARRRAQYLSARLRIPLIADRVPACRGHPGRGA
jgi:hypothetical protein